MSHRLILTIFVILWFVVKIFFFVNQVSLADEVRNLEKKTKILVEENRELEKKISNLDSFEYVSSMAAILGLTQEPKVIVVHEPNLAYGEGK